MRLEDLCSDLVMIPSEHKLNLLKLLEVLNPLEQMFITQYGRPWKVTNSYRFMAEHRRIYKEINQRRKEQKKKPVPVPMFSAHLSGNALDIEDTNHDLKQFVAMHLDLFEEAGIYFEAFTSTPHWVHMQQIPPGSGNRFFFPY